MLIHSPDIADIADIAGMLGELFDPKTSWWLRCWVDFMSLFPIESQLQCWLLFDQFLFLLSHVFPLFADTKITFIFFQVGYC